MRQGGDCILQYQDVGMLLLLKKKAYWERIITMTGRTAYTISSFVEKFEELLEYKDFSLSLYLFSFLYSSTSTHENQGTRDSDGNKIIVFS